MVFCRHFPRTLLLTLAAFSTSTTVSANLILNPGNEQALIAGEIPNWTEVVGSNWTQRSSNPAPYEGDHYFFAGSGPLGELAQLVDVSAYASTIDNGTQSFTFEGYVRSFNQSSPDTTRIVLEYLDIGSSLLDSFDSGEFSNRNSWDLVTDTRFAPTATRSVNVRLISDRNSGSNNDGYFDALSLTANSVPVPSSLALLGLGAIAFMSLRRVRKSEC